MVPVIEIGAVPLDAVIIEPSGAEFGFKTFAETAFGLGIYVDAFCFGNGAGRDGGWLATTLGRAGWTSE